MLKLTMQICMKVSVLREAPLMLYSWQKTTSIVQMQETLALLQYSNKVSKILPR